MWSIKKRQLNPKVGSVYNRVTVPLTVFLIALSLAGCTSQINVREDPTYLKQIFPKPPLPKARTLTELDRITLLLVKQRCRWEAFFEMKQSPVCAPRTGPSP